MKKRMVTARIFFTGVFLILTAMLQAQNAVMINAGVGYFGDGIVNPGVVGQLELERAVGGNVSLPTAVSLGLSRTPDYYALHLRASTGFRKYFDSGLFVEQTLGIGIIGNVFTVDSIWYGDEYGAPFRYADGLNFGISPSVSLGAGINLSREQNRVQLLWIRPSAYWNLGLRGLNIPYAAVELGYTTSIGGRK